jgi:hypothetical protein
VGGSENRPKTAVREKLDSSVDAVTVARESYVHDDNVWPLGARQRKGLGGRGCNAGYLVSGFQKGVFRFDGHQMVVLND